MAVTRECKCGCGASLVSEGRGRPKEWCEASTKSRRNYDSDESRRYRSEYQRAYYQKRRLEPEYLNRKREWARAYYRKLTGGGQ